MSTIEEIYQARDKLKGLIDKARSDGFVVEVKDPTLFVSVTEVNKSKPSPKEEPTSPIKPAMTKKAFAED